MTGRKPGQRGWYVAYGVIAYGCTIVAIGLFPALDQGRVLTAFELVLAFLSVAVTGDTVRPSGSAMAAIGGTRPQAPATVVSGPDATVNVPPGG